MSDRVGAIDLGTNTALCLVAQLETDGTLAIVEDHCLTPRLGEGLLARGTLEPAAVGRALAALGTFAKRLAELRIEPARTRVVSTAVLRRARDAAAFVELVRARTGLAIEIISGEEEARLGARAVASAGVTPEAVVIDVGGGSTEVSCTALGFRRSLSIGAVLLTESCPAERYLERASEAVSELPAGLARDRDAVVLGGTGVNLACLALGLAAFDHERAEGARVDAAAARTWAEKLAPLAIEARCRFAIEPERAVILPAGLSLLAAVSERLSVQTLRVTGRGLRFGLALELLTRAERQEKPGMAPGPQRPTV